MGTLEYDSNNSGGSWWLTDQNWKDLEAAGWNVKWVKDDTNYSSFVDPGSGRYMGALARKASLETDDPTAGVRSWEEVTGLDSTAEGCNCCGEPHSFNFTDDNGNTRYMSVSRSVSDVSWD